MTDIIVIGKGPAGISAAIYTTRAGLKTTIIGKEIGSLKKAEKIENYYGFEYPISGEELFINGLKQVKRLGAEIIDDEVVSIGFYDTFFVKTKDKEYTAKSIIIATGSSRKTPNIKGILEFAGKGVSYCAVCDAFFYRGKDVAVLGSSEYALHEAKELSHVANSVTMLTNNEEPIEGIPDNIKVIKKEITAFTGDDTLKSVEFSDGSSLPISGVFVAIGVAGSSDLAKMIGAITEGNRIVTDENMATNIPGLYAAGDCTGGMLQVSKAVYEGAKAGTEAVKFVRKNQ